jgi:hypothetical protein
MNELESLEENFKETSTAYWEIERLYLEIQNCHDVCKYDTMMPKGKFIKMNNPKKWKEEVESFIEKLKGLGILIQTPSTDNRKKYKWSGNPKKWVGILKELK